MKNLVLAVVVSMFLVTGCLVKTAKFTIPDEPTYKTFKAYQVEGGVCLDEQGLRTLRDNVNALKESADKMRKILVDIQQGK